MFSNFNQTIRSKSQTVSDFKKTKLSSTSVDKIIPSHRRDKLKDLLLVKFMKKYGLKDSEHILDEEITNFLRSEKLTDKDLKRFDDRLNKIISERKSTQNLRQNLTLNDISNSQNILDDRRNNLPDLNNDNMSVVSKQSKMSGISKLSNFSDMNDLKLEMKKNNYKNFKEESERENKRTQNPVDLGGDNWDAINMYQKKVFEQEKIESRIKDREIKKRLKDDLDVQIRDKLIKSNAELLRNREFDKVVLQHVENMLALEKEREQEVKKKVIQEKSCRDNQLKDEIKKKRQETLKNKKYERGLVKKIKEEIEKEKQVAITKKEEEKQALMLLLKENESRRNTLAEIKQIQRDIDVKSCLDMIKVVDQREKDRNDYFKLRERTSGETNQKAIDTVVKDMKLKDRMEEEAIKKFEAERDKRADEDEQRRINSILDNKKEMRKYLDMQVEEKQRIKEYNKIVDSEQGRIWRKDAGLFKQQEEDTNSIIKNMYKAFNDDIKVQIKNRVVMGKEGNM